MSSPGIGASSILGLAFEVTPGTFVAPVKFVPFLSESLKVTQDTYWRRPVRATAGLVGAVPGNSHVEGDIEFEVTTDVILYFLYASRMSVNKTGAGPYTYAFTPTAVAIPPRTLSISIVRNGIVFGYSGCVVGSFKISVDDGVLKMTASIIGRDESTQSSPTAVWPTLVPFGAGSYNIQIPTSTQVFDTDSFEFESNDNAAPQFRMKDGTTGAQFVSFGESEGTINVARDFTSKSEHTLFKAVTAQTITLLSSQSVSDRITILAPVSIIDTYEVNIGGQGDLVRASVTYQLAIDSSGKHYLITVVTPTESIT